LIAQEPPIDLATVIRQQAKLIEEQGKRLDAQSKQLEEQERRLQQLQTQISAPPIAGTGGAAGINQVEIAEAALKKIGADYLHENPGAGMPPSVQTGYELGKGFIIRSAPSPKYIQWEDESKIPFELRIRGRVMFAYYGYKSNDSINHQTGLPASQNANTS